MSGSPASILIYPLRNNYVQTAFPIGILREFHSSDMIHSFCLHSSPRKGVISGRHFTDYLALTSVYGGGGSDGAPEDTPVVLTG